MFISSALMIAALLIITVANRRNRFTYIISSYLFGIAMSVIVCSLYVSKISNYYFPLKIDYAVFLWFSKIPIHLFQIARMYNVCIAIYMLTSAMFCRTFIKRKSLFFFLMCLPIAYYIIVNDPTVSWKLYIALYSTTGLKNTLIRSLVSFSSVVCTLMLPFYMAVPLIFLARYYMQSRLRIRRMNTLVLALCFLLIDIFYYFMLLNGFFTNVVDANAELTKFPAESNPVSGYLLAPIFALVMVIAVIFIVLYYKPFNYVTLMKKHEAKRNAEMLNKNSNIILHAYKNAFIGISRFTQTLEKSLEAGDTNTAAECNLQIRQIADDYITKITKTTRIFKDASISYGNVEISDCIHRAVLGSHIPEEIKFSMETDGQAHYVILGDSVHITEVFHNLVENAIQAIQKKIPQSPEIKIRLYSEDMFIIAEVTDNGCGISQKDRKKIFRAFFSSKSMISAGGLGLTYARNIVTLHHGDIEVESEPGVRTVFRVVLPKNYRVRDIYEY